MKKMLAIKKTLPFGREKLVLMPEKKDSQQRKQLNRLKENETMLTFMLTIKTLKAGDYFGVGESMKDLFIVTREKVFYVMGLLLLRSFIINRVWLHSFPLLPFNAPSQAPHFPPSPQLPLS